MEGGGGIYLFETEDGPYVGQTRNSFERRWKQHAQGKHRTPLPGTCQVLHDDLDDDLLDDYEAFEIGRHGTYRGPGSHQQNRLRGNTTKAEGAYEIGADPDCDELDLLLNGMFREISRIPAGEARNRALVEAAGEMGGASRCSSPSDSDNGVTSPLPSHVRHLELHGLTSDSDDGGTSPPSGSARHFEHYGSPCGSDGGGTSPLSCGDGWVGADCDDSGGLFSDGSDDSDLFD